MEFAALAEFIGFDVIFIGILTVLAARAGVRLWDDWSSPFGLCKGAIADCENLFGEPDKQNESEKQNKPGKQNEPGKQTKSAKSVVGVLVLAAVAGMIANFVADQILDSGMLKRLPLLELDWKTESETTSPTPTPTPTAVPAQVPAALVLEKPETKCEAKSKTKSETTSERKGLRAEEDWIKASVFCNIANDDPKLLTGKVTREEFCEGCNALKQREELPSVLMKPRKKAIDEGQRFFREALAKTQQSGSAALVGSLQAELLVVRVFRVLFLYSVLLMLVSCVTVASADWRKPGTTPSWSAFRTLLALAVAAYFCLWGWAYQSKRYYKKLGQAYITVASQRSGALF